MRKRLGLNLRPDMRRRALYRMGDYLKEKYAGRSIPEDQDSQSISSLNPQQGPIYIARRACIEERKVRKVLKTPEADDCEISYALRIQAE